MRNRATITALVINRKQLRISDSEGRLHPRAIKFISGTRLSRDTQRGMKTVVISGVPGSDSCFRITAQKFNNENDIRGNE